MHTVAGGVPLHLPFEIQSPILFRPCSAANTDHVAQPGRSSFKPPKQVGVDFALEVVVEETLRTKAFDVPLMQVFV